MEDKQKHSVVGEFKDVITYEDGTVVETDWTKNTIVLDYNTLVACLLKGEAGYLGIKYWAVGSGLPAWDTTLPNPTTADKGCTTEFFRKAIPSSGISFIDNGGSVTATPTNKLQVTLSFTSAEAVGKWREFAIFGGNASATANSGLAINHKTHGTIDKTSGMTIDRTIRFTLQ